MVDHGSILVILYLICYLDKNTLCPDQDGAIVLSSQSHFLLGLTYTDNGTHDEAEPSGSVNING